MKFLTLTLAAVLTLAFSFTATPAEAGLEPLAKCRVYNAKIKMNYAKCLELDNLLVEKGKAAKGICESKRTTSLEKATAKFVTKLGVDAADCGIDTDTADAQRDVQLLASANSQSACEDANGTWESGTCTAGSSYNCTIAAMCSAWHAAYPLDKPYYINNYDEATAENTGCPLADWNSITSIFPSHWPTPLALIRPPHYSMPTACG